MAHELTQRENGLVEMAFTGPREAIWHGLGQNLEEGVSIEEWKKAAGMDWDVHEAPVTYSAPEFDATTGLPVINSHMVPDRKVVFRSDTKESLGIVGHNFKVVQPGDVLEFFRDLVDQHGFRLSTAGTLFGGRKFWALADTGKSGEVTSGDRIDGHLLLTTGCDGSMSTQARFTSTRVVCNNTLTVALAGAANKPVVRVTHKRAFDPDDVKIDLGILDASWVRFMNRMKALANRKMTASETRKFFEEQLFDPNVAAHEQGWGKIREVDTLTDLALYGSGSDMSRGTAYGALCAITEHYTHGRNPKDASRQFWGAYMNDTNKTDLANALIREYA